MGSVIGREQRRVRLVIAPMCYIVVVLCDMVKERWWSATDIKHRKHVKTCYLRDRVRLGFRDKVRVSVLVRVRVSLGFRDRVRVRLGSVLDSPLSCILYGLLCPLGLGLV